MAWYWIALLFWPIFSLLMGMVYDMGWNGYLTMTGPRWSALFFPLYIFKCRKGYYKK